MRLKDAVILVRSRRPFIRPNNGFFQQLIDYEKKLFKKTTVAFITQLNKSGDTVKVPDIMINVFHEKTEKDNDPDRTIDSLYGESISSKVYSTLI